MAILPTSTENLFVFSSENSLDFFVSDLKLSFVRKRHFFERFFTLKTNLSNELSLELEAYCFRITLTTYFKRTNRSDSREIKK